MSRAEVVNVGRRPIVAIGSLLSLACLVAMTFGSAAHATNPGLNGRIGCEGVRGPAVPNPNPTMINRSEIFTINPNGTDERVLTDNPFRDGDPSFSPDGKFIAFESFQSGTSEAYRMRVDGTEVTRLTFNGTNANGSSREDRGTNWSADGRKIVFHSTRDRDEIPVPGSPFEVYIMNSDGSNQTRLTNNAFQDSLAAISPDGRKIAFLSNREGDFEIYKMNVDGTQVERLTNTPGEDSHTSWSPDGRQITFHSRRDNPDPANATNVEIYRMNADGSNPTRLTTTPTVAEIFPVWSPDGTRIAFDTFADVFTIRATDGGDLQQVTTTPVSESRCDWQPIPRPAAVPPPNYPVPPAGLAQFPDCPAGSTNTIRGGTAGSLITGTAAGDRIFGGTGNDTVNALGGDDCLDLGVGTDRGDGGTGNDLIVAGDGNDRGAGGAGNDALRGNPGNDRLDGGAGNDRVAGDAGNDVVAGAFGNDRLHGVGGNDVVSGSRGRDRINGGAGSDRITGGSSGDRIAGDAGNDRIAGDSGNDRVTGDSGRDRISGGSGRATLSGGLSNDRISARDGNRDTISCGKGRDSVTADRNDRVGRDCERVSRR